MRTEKHFTKRAMAFVSFRMKQGDAELMRAAAAKEEISQSEFLREAIRERARRVLLNDTTTKAGEARRG